MLQAIGSLFSELLVKKIAFFVKINPLFEFTAKKHSNEKLQTRKKVIISKYIRLHFSLACMFFSLETQQRLIFGLPSN